MERFKGVWLNTHDVWVDARLVHPPLSPPQFKLLSLLYEQPGKIIPKSKMVSTILPDYEPSRVTSYAIDGLIQRLGKRLQQTQPKHDYIQVVRGQGLRLVQPDDEP